MRSAGELDLFLRGLKGEITISVPGPGRGQFLVLGPPCPLAALYHHLASTLPLTRRLRWMALQLASQAAVCRASSSWAGR